MLNQLTINNLAIVHSQTIDLAPGLTVLTGETGAGKSLLLDGLGLILGERADSSLVTQGKTRAEVSAVFDLSRLPAAQAWLTSHELEDPDHPSELHVRRTLTQDGRSKAYLNNRPVTLADLRTLSSQLVSLQGQHAQYALLNPDAQLKILDKFGELGGQKSIVRALWHDYQQLEAQRQALALQIETSNAQRELLTYQAEELAQAELVPDEVETLERELKQLANAHSIQSSLATAENALIGEEGDALSSIQRAIHQLQSIDMECDEILQMLNEAAVNVEESAHQVQSMAKGVEENPQRLREIDERLRLLTDLARKHRIETSQLYDHAQALEQQLSELSEQSDALPALQAKTQAVLAQLNTESQKLSEQRSQVARDLAKQVTEQVRRLELEDATIDIQLTPKAQCAEGQDQVAFLFSANPGSTPKALSKVASGGELSRVALSIQVCIAEKMDTPTLIFDEVDVGIGGRTAAVVGELLKALGASTQVFVVTHQPQVAAAGQTHLHVSKIKSQDQTQSSVRTLQPQERVEEVARMLGGLKLTEATRKSAQELIMSA